MHPCSPPFQPRKRLSPSKREKRFPIHWGRGQRALDPIFAVADGTVAYINAVAGNSTYGIYVVLTHEDEFGIFYTLYSHLASVAEGLRAGMPILRGEVLGIMGNTPAHIIPAQRSHLHFEVGVINNHHFFSWYRQRYTSAMHGRYHGANLTGIDPMILLLALEEDREVRFSMQDAVASLPMAWRLAFQAPGQLDYFRRHPQLWDGPPHRGGVMVVDFCQSGTPLRGRSATPEEAAGVTARAPRVLEVNTEALGRNGRRKILRSGGGWRVSDRGMEWLEILLYRAGS